MGDYVQNLRGLVGHYPIQYCTATIIVVDGDRILLQRRSDTGEWGFHGSAVELGEHPEAAAARELREETGLVAGPLAWFGVFAGNEHHFIYPNGDEVHIIDHVYLCRAISGAMHVRSDEVLELAWFPLSGLPARIFPLDQPILKAFLAQEEVCHR